MRKMLPALIAGVVVAAASVSPEVRADVRDTAEVTGGGQAVTLLTGDRVVLTGGRQIIPGPGREHIRFTTSGSAGHLFVVPSDAAPLVAAGKLDRRLFDVRQLLDAGYGDADQAEVPLIVTWHGRSGRTTALRQTGLRPATELKAVGGDAVRVPKRDTATTWQRVARSPGVKKIWLDGRARLLLDQSVLQIGAPAAWQAGYTGKGVTVAVLDSGVDTGHPDLAAAVSAAKDFTGEGPSDGNGHGTHVASTIAGTAAASGGRFRGVAPDAKLLDGKVCGVDGFCDESAIVAGMQWAAVEQQADVVNLSLGGPDTPGLDLLEETVNTLTRQTGAMFVIAAGNDGESGAGTIGSPGSADEALTVGAVDKQDELAAFSSRGPRVGDNGLKPDLTAPGVDIVAAKAADATIGEPVGEHYLRLSGTSMATPHTAGAAALLLQQHPDWAAPQVKAALMGSAEPDPELVLFEQGAGRLDVEQAIGQRAQVEPASLSFGLHRWPHHDDEPVTKDLTYRNLRDTAVNLSLSAAFTGPDGSPAPGDMLRLGANQVSVPAHGTATVRVTVDTSAAGPDGVYTGRVTATGDGTAFTTPLTVVKEVESYDLTVRHLDRHGQPASDHLDFAFHFDTDTWHLPYDADGNVTVRLPKGLYQYQSAIYTDPWTEQETASLLLRPRIDLSRDTELVMDARTAGPVSIQAPEASAQVAFGELGCQQQAAGGTWAGSGIGTFGGFGGIFVAQQGPAELVDGLTCAASAQLAEPGPDGQFRNSPYVYAPVWVERGRYFNGFERTVRKADVAKVTMRFAAQVSSRRARVTSEWESPALPEEHRFAVGLPLDLPATQIRYLMREGVRWRSTMQEYGPETQTTLVSAPRSYDRGGNRTEHWNGAVFGPAFPAGLGPSAVRATDRITAELPLYSDRNGHAGTSRTGSASTVLYRDGSKVTETPDAGVIETAVPAEAATYRLEVSANRASVSDFTTGLTAAWTFRSSRTAGEQPLPLWAVRFLPELDEHNARPRDPVLYVPVTAEAQPGAAVGKPGIRRIEVSGDDGKTWGAGLVIPAGGERWLAIVPTPRDADHVSLRADLVDSEGNTAEHTIIRAFALTP